MAKKTRRTIVAVNELGYRIGSSHQNATIPDDIVDAIRDMHEDRNIGYRKLAIVFNLSRGTIAKICTYERRAQTPDRYKTIREDED
jgi:hypothetical protein